MPAAARRLIILLLCAAVAVACAPTEITVRKSEVRSGIPAGAQQAVVERIVDGDTLWVRVDEPGGPLPAGATHKVRLLGIDTPETQGPGGVECGGAEATAVAERHLLVGATVHLIADREDKDRYDRYLRYLWTDDGMFFNSQIVRDGLARAVLYQPNDAYIDRLRADEAEARDLRRGIWGDLC